MTTERSVSPIARHRAVMRALHQLYAASLVPDTFAEYGGHLLLAFALIARTSRSARIRGLARRMGIARASDWRGRWPETAAALDADTIMQAVIASHAVAQLGDRTEEIREQLAHEIGRWSTADLLYFDPVTDVIPDDIPYECACGRASARAARRCQGCSAPLRFRSRYDVWYYALTSVYFCERQGMPLPVTFAETLTRLADLRPYPQPGSSDFYDAIYAVTHVVYTLTDYGAMTLAPGVLPHELAFLRGSMDWALQQGEPDTVGELVDSLVGIGVSDVDPQITRARRFLLDGQLPDGTWGDESQAPYAFHTLWTAIDGLRDHLRRRCVLAPSLEVVLDDLAA